MPVKTAPSHAEADKIRPRLAKATVKALRSMRERVDVAALTKALQRKDKKAALAACGVTKDALTAPAAIVSDTVIKGGKYAVVKGSLKGKVKK